MVRDGRTHPVDAGCGRSSSSIHTVVPTGFVHAIVFECMFI